MLDSRTRPAVLSLSWLNAQKACAERTTPGLSSDISGDGVLGLPSSVVSSPSESY